MRKVEDALDVILATVIGVLFAVLLVHWAMLP